MASALNKTGWQQQQVTSHKIRLAGCESTSSHHVRCTYVQDMHVISSAGLAQACMLSKCLTLHELLKSYLVSIGIALDLGTLRYLIDVMRTASGQHHMRSVDIVVMVRDTSGDS